MNQLTIAVPDDLYNRLAQHASALRKTPEEIVLARLSREFGERFLDSETAKTRASAFLRQRAGKCLTVRDPILEEAETPVWLVPVMTNVTQREAAFVGQIVVNAESGAVLNAEQDVVQMVKKGLQSLSFQMFPLEKQNRLAELLAENQQQPLDESDQREMENLMAEEQALQIQNLEMLEKRQVDCQKEPRIT